MLKDSSKLESFLLSDTSRHPFDSTKWRRVCKFLVSDGFLEEKSIVEPLEASNSDLLVVHFDFYF